jgi:hypothetical protein
MLASERVTGNWVYGADRAESTPDYERSGQHRRLLLKVATDSSVWAPPLVATRVQRSAGSRASSIAALARRAYAQSEALTEFANRGLLLDPTRWLAIAAP